MAHGGETREDRRRRIGRLLSVGAENVRLCLFVAFPGFRGLVCCSCAGTSDLVCRMTCIAEGALNKACVGRGQRHHLVPRMVIRGQYTTLKGLTWMRREELMLPHPDSLPSLAEALADERNLTDICALHHELLTNGRFKIPVADLPDDALDFARELKVDWFYDRGTLYSR